MSYADSNMERTPLDFTFVKRCPHPVRHQVDRPQRVSVGQHQDSSTRVDNVTSSFNREDGMEILLREINPSNIQRIDE